MGFKLRKSINLGGGARINLSKSGIGGSIGTKGFRVTQTAKGTTRKTTSIPGTGISWIEETGKGTKKNGNVSSQGIGEDKKKAKGCGTGCLTIIIFIFLIGAMKTCFSSDSNDSEKSVVIEEKQETKVIESNLKPFRQNENALNIIEKFAKENNYEITESNEPKTVSGMKINYYSKYFEKKIFMENKKLNLRYNFYISYQDNSICIFEIMLNNNRNDKDSTKELFGILKKEFSLLKGVFNSEDYSLILSALDEAKSSKSDGINFITKSTDNILIEIPVYKNEVRIRVSMDGN